MRVLRKLAVAIAMVAMVFMGVSTPASAAPNCDVFTTEVKRVVNPKSDASVVTQYDSEVASAAAYGFTENEGPLLNASRSADTGLTAVWRMYNRTTYDFTWALDGAAADETAQQGYVKQFVQFYASATDEGCLSPAYRMQKGAKTRLVVSDQEKDALEAAGWTLGEVAFHAVDPLDSDPEPPVTLDPAPTPSLTASPTPQPPTDPRTPGDPRPGDFVLVAIPDTQQEVWSDSDTRLKERSEWLVSKASELNIKFVTNVGDVVDWGVASPAQFTRAQRGYAPLNGALPWSTSVGNHDTAAVCQGGGACPGNIKELVRDTTAFNAAFPSAGFAAIRGAFEAGKLDNAYHTFTASDTDWLVLNLELWPRPEAVTWARQVVAQHPRHNVVVVTHAYLEPDGSIGTSAGGYGATSPRYLWDNLIKVYPNIKVVLSGHVGGGASRVDTGANGNKIVSLMQTYHDRTTNPTRLIRINVADGTLTHWVYAPRTSQTMSAEQTVSGMDFTP